MLRADIGVGEEDGDCLTTRESRGIPPTKRMGFDQGRQRLFRMRRKRGGDADHSINSVAPDAQVSMNRARTAGAVHEKARTKMRFTLRRNRSYGPATVSIARNRTRRCFAENARSGIGCGCTEHAVEAGPIKM